MKNKLKLFLKSNNYLYKKIILTKKIGFPLLIINFIYQRIFRINSRFTYSTHFTSQIIFQHKIKTKEDISTLASFAVSGHCYFQALNGIEIGSNFLFASGVKIISSNHDFLEKNNFQKEIPIIIGDNVWLGANVILLPGIKLGNNCIVGAGSIVTKKFEESNLIIAGNPAKIIKRY
ncbi:MAG: acyltransferase [Campylobacterota bacterium]|nr:acyltransferase [Campylobacterota bacterium]